MMRLFSILALALTVGLGTVSVDAEAAKRMGSGKSMGTQRQAQPDKTPPAATATPAATTAAAGGAAASTGRSWMGPVAGLAAGLGLAALASHFGFGEELASMMMMGLLAVAVMAAVAYFMRRRAGNKPGEGGGNARGANPFGLQPAPVNAGQANGRMASGNPSQSAAFKVALPPGYQRGGSLIGSGLASGGASSGLGANAWPADFDAERFETNAKANFLRLQSAHDTGNLAEITQFTTPEMAAALRDDWAERGAQTQTTEVIDLQAKVVDVEEDAHGFVVSVRFSGTMRDTATLEGESFAELWHLTKGRDSQSGWLLAGIQQMD